MAGGLTSLTTDDDLRPLWKAVHKRLCRGGVSDTSVIAIPDATSEVRRAVDRLLGRVSGSGPLRVPLGRLNIALAQAGTDAAALATTIHGPVIDRRAARAAAIARTGDDWAKILSHPAAADTPLADWLARARAEGRLGRSGGTDAFLAALDVLAVLPLTDAPVGRPVLAAAVLGGEHDLDDATPAARLVTAGLAARFGIPVPPDASGRAALWAAAGVTFDAVSTPALTLGLRPAHAGPLTRAAATWAHSGVPLPLPAAAIAAEPWRVPAGQVVSVCENPSVIEAAAAQLGPTAPPTICVSGMPGRAVTALLTQLSAGGARLRYHGDFGAGGITIANLIIARHGAVPWRMSVADHDDAVRRLAGLGRTPTPLRGRTPEASWDRDLASAIDRYGAEITEEHVLEDLLTDLRAAPHATDR